MTTTVAVPRSTVDPFATEVLINPGSLHTALRDAGPVVYLERYDAYAIARYAEVRAVLSNWQVFESSAGVGLSNFRVEKPWRPPSLLLESDPPVHDAPRHVLSTLLQPRTLRRLRDTWEVTAAALVDEVLGGASQGDAVEIDVVATLAREYPLRVFPDAVGLGQEGRENLIPYGEMLFNLFGPRNELVEACLPRLAPISAWINGQCEREALSPGGFGEAIWKAADRGDITHDQAPIMVRSLLSAGVDTTVLGIQAVMMAFSTHTDQWARIVADPGLVRVAFDEAVRWVSPVQTFFRTATSDVSVGGMTIPNGEKVLLFYGAANRDPRRWEDPDVFDLDRDPSGHVGFGFGIHQCVGQHVARLEADCLLRALAARVRAIEPAGDAVAHPNNTLRGWEYLPVRLVVR